MKEGVIWRCGDRVLDLTRRGEVMGILNVTPDSFSDGGRYVDRRSALARALAMLEEGAAIIDVGGESTRPGAEPVSEEEERERVIPVIRTLCRERPDALVSIDTSKAGVAEAALEAGARIINDVTGLRGDARMAAVAAASGAGVVVMHMQGTPRDMQRSPRYDDVVAAVSAYFGQRLAAAGAAGIESSRVALDPGIGFGKTLQDNLDLIRALDRLDASGRPLLLGISRKSFIGALTGSPRMEDRHWPTVALTSYARELGARLHRVHEVRPCVEALRMTEAILGEAAG